MSREHRSLLRRCYSTIIGSLQTENVINYLYENEVLNATIRDDIRSHRTRQKQAESLVDYLETQGPDAVQQFIKALEISSQTSLHNKILLTVAQQEEQRVPGNW